jgi:hypothetical protein
MNDKNAELKFRYLKLQEEGNEKKSTGSNLVVVVCVGFLGFVIVFSSQ